MEAKLTGIHGFIPSLHNGPVDAWHQPGSRHHAAQEPQNAVAETHHHVVEEEEVVEAVECLSEKENKNKTVVLRWHPDSYTVKHRHTCSRSQSYITLLRKMKVLWL